MTSEENQAGAAPLMPPLPPQQPQQPQRGESRSSESHTPLTPPEPPTQPEPPASHEPSSPPEPPDSHEPPVVRISHAIPEAVIDGADDADAVAAPDLSGFTKAALRADATAHGSSMHRRRMSAEHIARIRRKRRRRRILIVVGVLLLALIAYIGYIGWSAVKVKNAVTQALQGATSAQNAINSGDPSAIAGAVGQLSQGIDAAWNETKSPAWAPLEWIPYFGGDVATARDTIDILHNVSTDALPGLARAAGTLKLDSISVKDSTVSMPGLAASAPDLAQAASSLNEAKVELNNLSRPHIGQLADALDKARSGFDTIAGTVDVFSRIAQTAPSMLDLSNQGERTYLVIAQNNAELRPTGGLPGSWGTLTAKGGKLTLSGFVPETDLPLLKEPVSEEDREELGLFGPNLTLKPHDVNFTPDYPRAAKIASDMWKKAKGQQVDGVIMIDPVLLQNLLAVTGGFTSNGVTFDGSNTVKLLLHDSYFQHLTPNEQDALFSMVAHDAFMHVLSASNGQSVALIKAVMNSVNDGHLYVWSASGDEQVHISGTAISGELETKPAEPTASVYFSDGTQGKMDWYLDRTVTAERVASPDGDEGSERYTLHVTMRNTLAASEVDSLPAYVSGEGMSERDASIKPGEIVTMVYVYAPAEGRMTGWKLPGDAKFDMLTTHKELTVAAKKVTLKPGESYSFDVTVAASPKGSGAGLTVRQTPRIDGKPSVQWISSKKDDQ